MPDVFISPEPLTPKPVSISDIPPTEKAKSKFPGHSHNKLSAFTMYPEQIDFETREKGEKIILLLRAHPITNFRWIAVAALMVLAPGFVQTLGFLGSFPAGFGLVLALSWYLITMAYALENFLTWYFNVYFVTTHRIIDVDFYNLIYKQVSDANLDRIQDVTYNMGGVIRTVFNYGNIFIQTAGEVTEFEFLAVPSPDKVAKIIQDLLTKDI